MRRKKKLFGKSFVIQYCNYLIMHDFITRFFSSLSLSPELTTFLLSMTPIGELRLGIPWGISMYGFTPLKAFIIAFLGNNLINLILFYLASPIINWFEKQDNFIGKIVAWIRDHLKAKGEKYLEKWGTWGIFIITLIPLPGFGGWTGAGAAALLGIKSRHAIPALIGGTFVAGVIVLASTIGFLNFA